LTIYSRLESGLAACLNLTRRLTSVVNESSDALVECDYERFTGLSAEQVRLSGEFRRQESVLRELLAETAREIGLQGVVTLSRIAEHLAGQDLPDTERLNGAAFEMKKSAAELNQAITTNASLLRNLDQYSRVVFKLLLGFQEPAGYGPPAHQPAVAVARHFVDREV
jgi:hypothetical protein